MSNSNRDRDRSLFKLIQKNPYRPIDSEWYLHSTIWRDTRTSSIKEYFTYLAFFFLFIVDSFFIPCFHRSLSRPVSGRSWLIVQNIRGSQGVFLPYNRYTYIQKKKLQRFQMIDPPFCSALVFFCFGFWVSVDGFPRVFCLLGYGWVWVMMCLLVFWWYWLHLGFFPVCFFLGSRIVFFFPTDLWVCMDLLIYSLHIDRSNQPRWCGPRTVCKLPFLFSFPIAHTPGPPNSMGLE